MPPLHHGRGVPEAEIRRRALVVVVREVVELGRREQVVVQQGAREGGVRQAGRDGEEGVEFCGEVG